jgi:hypothetical protein
VRTLPLLCGAGLLAAQAAGAGTWTRGAAMPTERAEVGAEAVDGAIYVVGAYSGLRNANEAYAPATDSWRTLDPLPRGLNHVCAVGLDGLPYFAKGPGFRHPQ